MAEIRRNARDRILLGYENEYERLAFMGSNEGSAEVRSSVRELAGEFRDFFGISETDNTELRKKIQSMLDKIRIDGSRFDFLRAGDWLDNDAAMACAMAKIKRMSLYERNEKSSDGAYHIVFFDVRTNKYDAISSGIENEELPEKPEKPGFFSRVGPRMEVYKAKLFEYNEAVERKNRAEQIAKNNEKYIKKASEEASFIAASDERTGASVKPVSIHELMGEKNGIKGSLRQRLEGAKSYTRRNSTEYDEFLHALDEVSKTWDKVDSPENIKLSLKAYDRLEKACNAYIEGHSSKRHSGMGRDRVDIVKDVLNLQRRERKELESYYNTYSANKEEDLIGKHVEKARRIEINTENSSVERIGAATSTRLHIKNDNEDIIFTPDKEDQTPGLVGIAKRNLEGSGLPDRIKDSVLNCITISDDLTNKISEINEEKDVYKLLKDYNLMTSDSEEEKNKWENFAKSMIGLTNTLRQTNTLDADNISNMLSSLEPPADKAEDYNKLINNINAYIQISAPTSIEGRLTAIKDLGICTNDDLNNPTVKDELADICKGISAEIMSRKVGSKYAGIDNDRLMNLNERSIATSVLAEIIGCPDVVAKTQKAVLTDSGTEREGISMEFVKGVQGDRILADIGQRENMAARGSGSLKKQIADLQVLDILSGQVDRHRNNIMFITDSEGVVTDIKGIDNDMSFGITELCNGGKHSINLGMITHIDATTAQNIMNLDRKFINYKFKDLLSERETDALWNRISVMQKWLEEPHVHKVPTDNWNNMNWHDLAQGQCDIVEDDIGIRYITNVDPKKSNQFFKVALDILPLTKDADGNRIYMNNHVDASSRASLQNIADNAKNFEKNTLESLQRAASPTQPERTAQSGGISR